MLDTRRMLSGIIPSGMTFEALRGKMTQADLAAKSGLTQPTISRLDNGLIVNPSYNLIKKLAKALGTSTDAVARAIAESQKAAA